LENSVRHKVELVRGMLERKNCDCVLIQAQVNLSWLTGGRYFVNLAAESGNAGILITPDQVLLVANNIEGERLWREEMAGEICDRLLVYRWYAEEEKEALVRENARGLRLAYDDDLKAEFRRLRTVMTAEEQQRYAVLGRLAGEAVEEAALACRPGETEYQIAGRLAGACFSRGLEPVVCLVGSDERAFAYRHPLPTGKRLAEYVLLILVARKWGLHASLSRAVYFGRLPAELAARQRAVLRVEARCLAATGPGMTLGGVYDLARKAYIEEGYDGEWEYHHQGGLTGYQSREIKALPGDRTEIVPGQVLAWNPTIRGTKAEDTVLVTDAGLELLTPTPLFPVETVVVEGGVWRRPFILTRLP